MLREKELAEQVARSLHEADIQFDTEVAIGGVQPDFVVYAPDGRKFVIEIKAWEKTLGFRNRAAHQAELYRTAIGADRAFVVVDGLERSRVSEGVVTTDRLIPALEEEFAKKEQPSRKRKPIQPSPEKDVFAAMPFAREYDDVFLVAMAHAAKSIDAVCKRVDREEFSGDIVQQIQSLIRNSIAVIVDLSESKPNVLYEAGYAHALGKPTVHICSTPLNELPFNVAHWNTIEYHKGQTWRLRTKLAKRLKAVVS
jgi:nucleoside 2-deoxyribosyltransferase